MLYRQIQPRLQRQEDAAGVLWKEKGMAGMRPEPSSLLPGQQGYIGPKKTLELYGGGGGGGGGTAGKWRAHEYTPLLPSEDGTKLVPAVMITPPQHY